MKLTTNVNNSTIIHKNNNDTTNSTIEIVKEKTIKTMESSIDANKKNINDPNSKEIIIEKEKNEKTNQNSETHITIESIFGSHENFDFCIESFVKSFTTQDGCKNYEKYFLNYDETISFIELELGIIIDKKIAKNSFKKAFCQYADNLSKHFYKSKYNDKKIFSKIEQLVRPVPIDTVKTNVELDSTESMERLKIISIVVSIFIFL